MAKFSFPFNFLWRALLLPSKNPKLFSNIFLIYIITDALLYTTFQLSIAPLRSKINEFAKLLQTIDPTARSLEFIELYIYNEAVTKQLRVHKVVYRVFQFVVSFSLSIIICYANSATCLGKILTLKELLKELLKKVKGITKGRIITQLIVALFFFILLVIYGVIVFAICFYVSINNYMISSSFTMIPLTLLATATLFLVYLAIIWSMSVAISIIVPNVYGTGAISCATKLLKGKKMQVFLLIFAFSTTFISITLSIASGIIYACNAIIMKFVSGSQPGSLVLGFVYRLLLNVVTLHSVMAVTVLYYECYSNQSNGGVGNKVEDTKLATTSSVDS